MHNDLDHLNFQTLTYYWRFTILGHQLRSFIWLKKIHTEHGGVLWGCIVQFRVIFAWIVLECWCSIHWICTRLFYSQDNYFLFISPDATYLLIFIRFNGCNWLIVDISVFFTILNLPRVERKSFMAIFLPKRQIPNVYRDFFVCTSNTFVIFALGINNVYKMWWQRYESELFYVNVYFH